MGTSDWEMISEDFLDYLAALSVDRPDLDTADRAYLPRRLLALPEGRARP